MYVNVQLELLGMPRSEASVSTCLGQRSGQIHERNTVEPKQLKWHNGSRVIFVVSFEFGSLGNKIVLTPRPIYYDKIFPGIHRNCLEQSDVNHT